MNFAGKCPCIQRARRSLGNPIQRVSKRTLILRQPCVVALAAFGAALAGGGAAWASPTLTTLATFNGSNGASPFAGLIADTAGNLYGTTRGGGAGSSGTVFEVAAGTHALSTLVTFDSSNGSAPYSSLIADAAGNFYGTTFSGGAHFVGTVFEVEAGTHALSTLATFTVNGGAQPLAGVIADAAGNLYGTTHIGGGTTNDGAVFEVAAGTHALSTLATFNGTNGANPHSSLMADAAGNLYGTTNTGGAGGGGAVFEVAAGTHVLSVLASFNYSNGAYPEAGLIADAAGNLYGTTSAGGANGHGTVFKVATGTHALSTLVNFNGINGSSPRGDLIADAAGNLFGTTYEGGVNTNAGTVFEVSAGTNALTTLATFGDGNGLAPAGGLIADAAGNLYGTTQLGAQSLGTVFELTDTGFVTSAPEPAAVSLIGLAALGLLVGRRRSRTIPIRATWGFGSQVQ
jgi:uncharacterized repeat protein (TIGR03803 family)